MAASDLWELKIIGRGGHGALPHETVDPIAAAGQVIVGLQTVVSRSIDPQESAVVSIGTIQAGQAFNIIPPHVELTGTIRTFGSKVRTTVLSRFEQIAEGICKGMGAQADLRVTLTCPALVNDPDVTEVIRTAAGIVLGPENIRDGGSTMGGEDAAFFLQEVPGCYMFLGAALNEPRKNYPNHHPRFDFNENALPLGVAVLAQAVCLDSFRSPVQGVSAV
jgi:amidohydrolase